MPKVCFIHSNRAYLPEVYAYSKFLDAKNISNVVVGTEKEAKSINAVVYYRFGGVLNHRISTGSLEVHEYHTVSTGKCIKLKNLIKSIFSVKPDYLSFLNKFVENNYFFSSSIPRFYRDMGADEELMLIRELSCNKEFDICYFGSLSNRKEVVNTILGLSKLGYSIVVGGNADEKDTALLNACTNITYLGFCERSTVNNYMAKSKFGLNIIPDEYPLNHQTSTKVIEYLVAGLPIISNSYKWIQEHSINYGYQYVELSNTLRLPDNIVEFVLDDGVAEQFTWGYILENCLFDRVIQGMIREKS